MRPSVLLLVAVSLAGCASSGVRIAHPRVSAGDTEAGVEIPLVEGRDFAVFRGDGAASDLETLVREAGDAEVVLFGEEHGDMPSHRLEADLLRRLFTAYQAGDAGGPSPHASGTGEGPSRLRGDRSLVLSMEMFERDVQDVVDEYLADLISENHFTASARAWDYYDERYRPAVEFAKAHQLPVVAANAPRRYVNRASRLGRESLAELPVGALATLPPLPYPAGSSAYRAEWDSLMSGAPESMGGDPFDGQTLWDAAMAFSIAQALEGDGNPLVLHFAGSFHVANFTGIPEALEHYRPGTRRLVLVGRPAEELDRLPEEALGEGDFVILTRETKSEGRRRPRR